MDFKISNVSREKIIEMLKEEQKVRYSKQVQDIYTNQYYASKNNPDYELVNIEREVQKFILNKFGFSNKEPDLKEYWKIPSTYWNDEEVKNSIFYMKLNIFQYSKIQIDDLMPDVSLVNYASGNEIKLSSLAKQGKPLVLLAGSMT